MGSDYSDTCHCPVCGRFVRHIWAERTEESLLGVWAKCIAHGKVAVKRFVDGEDVGWSWEDFEVEK